MLFGVLLIIPVGGADMPVVISMLNAFTGLSAAGAGFVLDNAALIIAGSLVGSSGTLLTVMMGRAMNRSLANVLFSAFGSAVAAGPSAAAEADGRTVREATVTDVATMLAYADKVIVVPGYGLAVAQAQHTVRELADMLEERGVDVSYAIHPVAGRMPGHMNVLLAEADVPYPQLKEMDEINPDFPQTDVALVIGANDVTNPAARSDQSEPDLRDADPGGGQGTEYRCAEAKHESGLRRHRQHALFRPEDRDAVRRRKGLGEQARRRSQGSLRKVAR